MSGILGMIFGKRKGMTTNPATRPFGEVVGSGMDKSIWIFDIQCDNVKMLTIARKNQNYKRVL